MMSSAATGNESDEICASCGIKSGDNVKLKNCTACKLVKYCGVQCQRNHRPQHKRACKKRAAELLKDDLLFKQPESTHLGDCPICMLPIPFSKSRDWFGVNTCCSTVVCDGCIYA
ncbi:MAG: zinc finger MYND domain-containing protein, partial [Desulfobacteraceae bacterium]|nr:zinc finger MYND domain-containing protein [Desulfobacteraceae bacterium]